MGNGVGPVGVIDHNTRSIGAMAHFNTGHVDTFTRVEIQSHSEQTTTAISVLAGTVANCSTILEGDVGKGYIFDVDECQSSVLCLGAVHCRTCSSESQEGEILEGGCGVRQEVYPWREDILSRVSAILWLKGPAQVSTGDLGRETFITVFSS